MLISFARQRKSWLRKSAILAILQSRENTTCYTYLILLISGDSLTFVHYTVVGEGLTNGSTNNY